MALPGASGEMSCERDKHDLTNERIQYTELLKTMENPVERDVCPGQTNYFGIVN